MLSVTLWKVTLTLIIQWKSENNLMRKEDWIVIAVQVAAVMGLILYVVINEYYITLKMAELGL